MTTIGLPESKGTFEQRMAQLKGCHHDHVLEAMSMVGPHVLGYTFSGFPANKDNQEALQHVRAWAAVTFPPQSGLVIFGRPGAGKTGLMVAALRWCAERQDGDLERWRLTAGGTTDYQLDVHRKLRELQAQDRSRKRPAPVCADSWPLLERRLKMAMRGGTGHQKGDENPTDIVIQEEIDQYVAVYGLDDVSATPASDWKQGALWSIVERPFKGRRVILTFASQPSALARFVGETLASRITDRRYWEHVLIKGNSLRPGV